MKNAISLNGRNLTLNQAELIALGHPVKINPNTLKQVLKSREFIKTLLSTESPHYGVNTGFGYLANQKISPEALKTLQLNLLKSHAAGFGPPLSIPQTRLSMTLRLNVLLKGHSGTSIQLCQKLEEFINKEIYPIIPCHGSVGASGDLAPLAHLSLPLTGNGFVHGKNGPIPALELLNEKNVTPLILKEKEGLTLINGTQVMLGIGTLAIAEAQRLLIKADKIAALSFEGIGGIVQALDPRIHQLRGHKGQLLSAARIAEELQGSFLYSPNFKSSRVQDPYSLRCAPQVHGPSIETIEYVSNIIEKELNAVTDNPIVFPEEELIISGGNFHGQALALPFDFACIAISEIANISERRLDLLFNPQFSELPPFLTPKPGINSGYMAAQYLSASLVNENKILSHPASTDSIPGNIGVEDHVSMGMTAARKLEKIIEHTKIVLSIELLAAAQAIDLRKKPSLGKGTTHTYQLIRNKVPTLKEDRIISIDIEESRKVFDTLPPSILKDTTIKKNETYSMENLNTITK